MSGRFVSIPADRLAAHLEGIGAKVATVGGSWAWGTAGNERIFELRPGKDIQGVVRIYTSVARGAVRARGCGQDAVRVIVGATDPRRGFGPVEASQKVLRTAPPGPEEQRVGAFLERLTEIVRGAYQRAKAVRPCARCTRPMRYREGRNGAFLGCSAWPECQHTERV